MTVKDSILSSLLSHHVWREIQVCFPDWWEGGSEQDVWDGHDVLQGTVHTHIHTHTHTHTHTTPHMYNRWSTNIPYSFHTTRSSWPRTLTVYLLDWCVLSRSAGSVRGRSITTTVGKIPRGPSVCHSGESCHNNTVTSFYAASFLFSHFFSSVTVFAFYLYSRGCCPRLWNHLCDLLSHILIVFALPQLYRCVCMTRRTSRAAVLRSTPSVWMCVTWEWTGCALCALTVDRKSPAHVQLHVHTHTCQ